MFLFDISFIIDILPTISFRFEDNGLEVHIASFQKIKEPIIFVTIDLWNYNDREIMLCWMMMTFSLQFV